MRNNRNFPWGEREREGERKLRKEKKEERERGVKENKYGD
jgi:hypothetical protein